MDATPLIGAAYDAALEPTRWNDFAQALSSACGGAPLLLALRAPAERHRGDVVVAGIEDHHRDAYRDGDWSTDPLIAEELALPAGAVLFRHEHPLAEAPADREFSRRWLAPQDIRSAPTISGLILGGADGPSAYLHVFSRRGRRALGKAEYTVVRGLMPHLQRAALVLREAQQLRIEHYAARLGLEARCGAVVLVDERGEVLFASDRAGILLQQAKLSLAEVAAFVAGALQLADGRRVAVRLGDARDGQLLDVVAQPAPPRPGSDGTASDLTLILLRDPAQPELLDAEFLEQLHGLTRAEARLAALVAEGISPAEAAARLGVSVHTVRRQLKDIFSKTGVSRQSALVALLAASPRPPSQAKPL